MSERFSATRAIGWMILVTASIAVSACGVRGKPQPPLTPPELGRGAPTFKRATEEFAFPDVPKVGATPVKAKPAEKDAR